MFNCTEQLRIGQFGLCENRYNSIKSLTQVSRLFAFYQLYLVKLISADILYFSAGHLRHPLPDNVIETHPDFRVIVLANRPGFPFLGNDFFGAMGKLLVS